MSSTDSFEYIDGDGVFRGSAAKERLAARERQESFEAGRGVLRVDRQRWQEAQEYERTAWLTHGARQSDDRNHHHLERFAGYSLIPKRQYTRGIELGCGPFTNMRLILERVQIGEVHLLDPLIGEYLNHPFCRYTNGRLGGVGGILNPRAALGWRRPVERLRDARNRVRVGGLRGKPVTLHRCGIEDFESTLKFDFVVMINVIEHCRDAEAIFEKIEGMLEPGGIFVFEDKVYHADAVGSQIGTTFDAGHPLAVDVAVLESFLSRSYDPLMHATYREVVSGGRSKQSLYFIGKKR
ncbi:MAG: class I SAM-dependent methyltransferase [Polyangiaceae bacterium]